VIRRPPTVPILRGKRTVSDRPTTVTLGFLTITQDPGGWLGGYLLTNAWGRPLEFRLSTAVQPTRVQAVLYGPTLTEYLHADLIGKTLVEKTAGKPDLIVTDSPPALALRSRVDVPVLAVQPADGFVPADAKPLASSRCPAGLLLPAKYAADELAVLQLLDAVDPAVDLAEPFARIREAVTEARKMGVTSRAA
jgi:hypothetical protein